MLLLKGPAGAAGEGAAVQVKITIPQVRASDITHPRTDPDEIYLAYYASLAKQSDGDGTEVRKYAAKKVSDVREHVKKGTVWTPEGLTTIIETQDAHSLFLNLGVYEFDNGKIYKKLKETTDVLINPEEFDWSNVEIPVNLTDVMSWVKSIWKLVSYAFNYLMEDDLIGTQTIAIADLLDTTDRGWTGHRELTFKSWGGDYRVTLLLEVLE